MAFSICSKISIPNSNFCGSTRELSSSSWSTSSNMETRRGSSLASHWRPSTTVGSATHGGSSKQHKETEYPTLSMSCTSSSLHGEDWWKRPSSRQGNHSSAGFPCDSYDTHTSSLSMTLGDGWNFEGNPFAPSSSSWSSSSPPSSSSLNSPKVYPCLDACTCRGSSGGVPVFVMLPLDSVSFGNKATRKRAMNASLMALKSAGVKGVMMDVWWGIVEKDQPGNYDWTGYKELVDMVKQFGLKVQAVMSFHQCGNNGDSCFIPLPQWVSEEIRINPELLYTDRLNRRSSECISLGCDTVPVLRGRSPVQVYTDYMRSFRDNFRDHLGNTIVEILVGMGPGGELRYPSYTQSAGVWRFPGIGQFQCYDKYMLASLRAAAEHVGVFGWGYTGPYIIPESSEFFKNEGAWNSPYGKFFLEWYSGMLLAHGERILTAAEGVFRDCRVKLSGKVAGIHWQYSTHSHAAELTAGYYNTVFRDGYLPIVQMFARHGVMLKVSCIEMRDVEQPLEAMCSPERLIRQLVLAARQAGVSVSGENALPRFDVAALKQVIRNSRLTFHDDPQGVRYEPMHAFTFLRMSPALFQSHNWRNFVPFVREMAQGQPSPNELDGRHRAAKAFLHDIRSLVFAYH